MIFSSSINKCIKGDEFKIRNGNLFYYKFDNASSIACFEIELDEATTTTLLFFNRITYRLELDFPIHINNINTNVIIYSNAYVLKLGKNFSISNNKVFVTNYKIDLERYLSEQEILFSLSNTQYKRIENFGKLEANMSYIASDEFVNLGTTKAIKEFNKYDYNFTNQDLLKIKQIDLYKGVSQISFFEQISESLKKLPGEFFNFIYGEEP